MEGMEGRTLPSLRLSRTALPANLPCIPNLVMSSVRVRLNLPCLRMLQLLFHFIHLRRSLYRLVLLFLQISRNFHYLIGFSTISILFVQ